MLRDTAARAELHEALREIEGTSKAVGRLRSVVSDLLDVARLDYGVFRLHAAPVDLAALLTESARTLARPEIDTDVRVQSTGEIIVLGDAARLRQCVDNLLSNAMDQSPKGGTVTLVVATQTRTDGEYATVEVIDEGPGVPPEMLPRIFERLASGRSSGGGLGLGLYLAKRIAELHGGELTVESSPGKGARFKLMVPCRPPREDAAGPERNPGRP